MKKKTSTIFTIFASIIYALSIFYFVFNLYSEYKKSTEYTKQKFENSVSLLKENINKLEPNKASNPKYSNELEKYLDYSFNNNNDNSLLNYTNCSYIEIFLNGTSIYKYLPASLPVQDTNYENESKLIKSFYTSFKVAEDNYFVKADLYKLRPYSIYYYSRISFLIILIVTIVTIIFIIILSNNKKTSQLETPITSDSSTTSNSVSNHSNSNYSDSKIEEINKSEDSIDNHEESDYPNETSESSDALNNYTSNELTTDDEDSTKTNNDESSTNEVDITNTLEALSNSDNNKQIPNIDEELPAELPINEIKPLKLENSLQENSKEINPEGLFSPVTGLGWEQYLMTRLDSEINRAISSEFDLSLFIIKITEISRDSETLRQVCDYLVSMFQFKDLLFEYKEDCIVAIKISMNIDEAITFADNLLPDINEILKDSFAKCYIGLSSKTIRLISGERLLHEAEEALKHAEESKDSPIIGFRADAEKFRKFFETKN